MASAQGNKKVTVDSARGRRHAGEEANMPPGSSPPWPASSTPSTATTRSLAKLPRGGRRRPKQRSNALSGLFAAARTTIADRQGRTGRVAPRSSRLLGRGLDQQQDDMKTARRPAGAADAGANCKRPPSPRWARSAARHVPDLLLRGWKGYGPGVRAQVLDVLLARADTAAAPSSTPWRRKQILALRDRRRPPPAPARPQERRRPRARREAVRRRRQPRPPEGHRHLPPRPDAQRRRAARRSRSSRRPARPVTSWAASATRSAPTSPA